MQITEISVFQIHGRYDGPIFEPGNRQAQALDVYPEFNRPRTPDDEVGRPIQANYVEIETDDRISGIYGPIQSFQVFHILNSLRPFLVGRDPLATEALFDQMMRLDRHGRSGMFMTAISSVDLALWDLKGKAWNQPVYRLLGGPTRQTVPAYASMLGFSTEPADAARAATEYKNNGFTAQKWFFRHGPGDGSAGQRKNLDMAAAVREAVGPDYRLMFDAFMGWDVPYAVEMVQALAPLKPFWMEEPVHPERVGALAKIRRASSVPIASGEHVYTRWQTRELLVNDAVDVLQNDPDWTGGITEVTRICALASSFDVPVVAHGHSLLPALHVAGAQSPTTVPYVEYLVRAQETKQFFHQQFHRPVNGAVALPDTPGLGLVLDEEKIERQEEVSI